MLKKLLILMIFIGSIVLTTCDITVKKCTYEIYQTGEQLQTDYVHYTIRLSDKCKDHTKDGIFYKLINVEYVNAEDIEQ